MTPLQQVAREIVTGPGRPAGVAIGLRGPAGTFTATAGLRAPGAASAPMTVDTGHDLASVTKVVATTTCLLRLVSRGALGLDDPVSRYVPAFTGQGKDTVTIRRLLRHRGGLWEWQPVYLRAANTADALAYVAGLPLRYEPDSGRHYSDLGFMLLGRVIEVVTGKSLDEAVRDLVTGPLGMASTRYGHPVGEKVAASAYGDSAERTMVDTGTPYPVLATGWKFDRWRDGVVAGEINDGNAFHAFDQVAGHAGLFSTVGDLLEFAAALADYTAHDELWDPVVVEQFLADGPDDGQVLGFRKYDFNGSAMYGHPGFVGCAVGFSPETGVALAMCSNRLLTGQAPAPTEELWTRVRRAANLTLAEHSTKARR